MKRIIFFLLCLYVLPVKAALWPPVWPPIAAWITVKELVIALGQQVGVQMVADYIENKLQPADVTKLNQSIAELKTQLQATQHDAPKEEVQQVQQLLASTEQLMQSMKQQAKSNHADLETTRQRLTQDVGLLQNELAQVRSQLRVLGAKLERPFAEQAAVNAPQIQVNYTYQRPGYTVPHPLSEGRILRSGDRYKITFHSAQEAWVYIFQIDSSGKIFQLFPLESMGGVRVNQFNPVAAGTTRVLPAPHKSFYLDEQIGIETLYFIATTKQDLALEASYQAYEQLRDTSISSSTNLANSKVELESAIVYRGPAGITDDPAVKETQVITTDDGNTFVLNASYLSGLCGRSGGCVNVLRFQHRR